MANRRTYTDIQLAEAVAAARCWADVMEGLGKRRSRGPKEVQIVVQRLGLDTSHFDHRIGQTPVRPRETEFSNPVRHDGRAGLSIAVRWFLARGYNVSVPLEPGPYDLITESDTGLKRVQVKTSKALEPRSGRYVARLVKTKYDATVVVPSSRGKSRQASYREDEIDYFFIAVSDGTCYLIPVGVVAGMTAITLDDKYAAFAVSMGS